MPGTPQWLLGLLELLGLRIFLIFFMLRSDLARLSLKALAVITLRVVMVRGASLAMAKVQMRRKRRVRIAIQGDNRQFQTRTVPLRGWRSWGDW